MSWNLIGSYLITDLLLGPLELGIMMVSDTGAIQPDFVALSNSFSLNRLMDSDSLLNRSGINLLKEVKIVMHVMLVWFIYTAALV